MISHTPYFLKSNQKKQVVPRVRTSIPAFLAKTYEMLENQDHSEIVCWSPDGKSFLIKNHNEFRDQVLPNYFKHNNYSSFVRQLNMYDFHKVRNDSQYFEYKNPLFQKGQQKQLAEIKRKSGEGVGQEDVSGEDDQAAEESGQLDSGAREMQISDYAQIEKEVSSFKMKQKDLEKAMGLLISQHESLIKDNKNLWDEIRRQSEQEEKRSEQFFFVLASCLGKMNQNNNRSNNFQNNPVQNQNMYNNNNNNQRALQISMRNNNNNNHNNNNYQNQMFQNSMDDLDQEQLQQLIPSSQFKTFRNQDDDYSSLVHDIQALSSNGVTNSDRNNTVYPLPIGKKRPSPFQLPSQNSVITGEFPRKIPKNQIQNLIERYQNGDPQNKAKIEQYLMNLVNSQGGGAQRQNLVAVDNRNSSNSARDFMKQQGDTETFDSHFNSNWGVMKKKKPLEISVFDKPKFDSICNDPSSPVNPIISGSNLQTSNQNNIVQTPMLMQQSSNQSQPFMYQEQIPSQEKNLFVQNESKLTELNELPQMSRNSNSIVLDSKQNYLLNPPPEITSTNFQEHGQSNEPLYMNLSPARANEYPQNIHNSPSYFGNGSFTPIREYYEDDPFVYRRSRHNSFHIEKDDDSEHHEFPCINPSNNNNNNNNNNSNSSINTNNNSKNNNNNISS